MDGECVLVLFSATNYGCVRIVSNVVLFGRAGARLILSLTTLIHMILREGIKQQCQRVIH